MAGVTTKKNLGKLFGGQIASINYNFQPSSQSSTATITVVNESQVFNKPEFGSTVSIPPFGIQMDVVSVTENKEGYKYLQVELVEHSHNILDKELVLIFGLHTTHKSELNNQSYLTFKSYFVEDSYWREERNQDMQQPIYPDKNLRSRNGLNILGFARATITDIESTPVNTNYEFAPDTTYLKFDKGVYKNDVSTALPDDWEFDENGPPKLSIEYGYYLTELRDLILKLGMRFEDGTESYLNDETIVFSDSGTLREVLTSVLAKIGMSFYMDPISQKIKIITNIDVARINASIRSRHKSFNEACASQLSYTESIKGVEAKHLVLKGDLNKREDERNVTGGSSTEDATRNDKFYRVGAKNITGLTGTELNYIYRFLPLVLMGLPDNIIEGYILGTARFENTTEWGNLYGPAELYIDGTRKFLRSAVVKPIGSNFGNTEWVFWNAVENNGPIYGDFNALNGEGAQGFGRNKANPLQRPLLPIDAGYINYIREFADMWGGIYVSDAMTEIETVRRRYSTATKRGGSVITFAAPSNAKITDIEPLTFLVNLLRKRGRSTDVTVGDLAAHTSANLSPIFNTPQNQGSNTGITAENWHVIAIHKIGWKDEEDLPTRLTEFIGSEMNIFVDVPTINQGTFLAVTETFQRTMQSLRRNFDRILRRSLRERTQSILVQFAKIKGDNSVQLEEAATSPFLDEGSPNFLRNIESQEKLFYKRSLEMMQMGVSEAELFLQNFGILNTQVPSPLISSSIRYDRAPLRSDFNIEEGLNNLSVSISANGGITTSISYSSRRFVQINKSIARDYLGSSQAINKTTIPSIDPDYRDAAHKNFT